MAGTGRGPGARAVTRVGDGARPRVPAGLLLVLFALLPGCAAGPAPRGNPAIPPAPLSRCWDLRYRVRFSSGEREGRGRLLARACGDGRLLAEVRGRVGPPVLVAAIREGRVRLLLPRRREAVDGPDVAATWDRWTGIPLPGGIVLERRPGARGGGREFRVGTWSGKVSWAPAAEDPCPYPARIAARAADGSFLVAERSGARPAPGPPAWPPVPRGFVHREAARPPGGTAGGGAP